MDIEGGVVEYEAEKTLCPPGQMCAIDAQTVTPTCVPITE